MESYQGLPPGFLGTIKGTASASAFSALAALWERLLPEARECGLTGARGDVYER